MHLFSLFTTLAVANTALSHSWEPIFGAKSGIVKEHLRERTKMISNEERHRQDHDFKRGLSETAKKADLIVKKIRQDEIDNFWRIHSTPGNEQDESFAGEMFPLARQHISRTKLWKIVRRLPKGALLHAHLTAMLPFGVLLETVIKTEGMAISSSKHFATQATRDEAVITFSHHNASLPKGASISSTKYKPDTPVPLHEAISDFPGGEPAFHKFIMSRLTILPHESIRHELGVDQIWRRFESIFDPAGSMLTYEPIVRKFYQLLFRRLADDGVRWVEVRQGGKTGDLVHKGEEDADPEDLDFWWEVMEEEIAKFQKTTLGKDFWGVRVIWSDYRGSNQKALMSSMKKALERKVKFPELFSGYDLVAQEDLGRTLLDLAPELLWFQDQAADLNLTVPFFFHAGETLGDNNSTDLNLFDAVIFGTRRIGHGFSLYKHPQLIDKVIDNNIMVEVCPISNEVLRLATDILHHPLPAMIAHGIPTAISNDDPAILGQDAAGLSYDFYQIIQGFDSVGISGLGALAHNSLRWSNFEDQSDDEWIRDIELAEKGRSIKGKRLREWNRDWEAYCEWIVEEYGPEWL